MKTVFFLPFVFLVTWQAFPGRAVVPVTWTFSAVKTGETTYDVNLSARLVPGWCILSQYPASSGGGPAPTRIMFDEDSPIVLLGSTREAGIPVATPESDASVQTLRCYEEVTFVQNVERAAPLPLLITGAIAFIACNEEQCTPLLKEKFGIYIEF